MLGFINKINDYIFYIIKSLPGSFTHVERFDSPDYIFTKKSRTYYNYDYNYEYNYYYKTLPWSLVFTEDKLLTDPINVAIAVVRKDTINAEKVTLSKYEIPFVASLKIDYIERTYRTDVDCGMYKHKLTLSDYVLNIDQREAFYRYMEDERFTLIVDIKKEKNMMYTDYLNLSYPPAYSIATNPEQSICWTTLDPKRATKSIKTFIEEMPYYMPRIDEIFYNAPNTVVKWTDGTITKVSAGEADFDKETGLSMCIAKRYMEACGKEYPRAAFKELVEKANDQTKKTADRKARKKKKGRDE